ncbi:MAG: carboxypeptidase-like regulatory domain-containing protein, partial [Candidatus Cyclobacteriaceae bacterium M3_2C_046]
MRFILIIGCCFISFLSYAQNISIYGYTKESKSLESIPYVHIFLDSKVGTYSNAYGFYSLEIPKGENIVLSFSSVGYQDLQISINTHKDSSINFFLEPKI